jgi:hypothetical protein
MTRLAILHGKIEKVFIQTFFKFEEHATVLYIRRRTSTACYILLVTETTIDLGKHGRNL